MKGAIAEAEIAAAAVRLGVPVLRPIADHCRYDLGFEIGDRLLRVQCKWGKLQGDVVVVRVSTCRLTPNGYVKTSYRTSEVDLVGVYCGELDRCFLLPISLVAGKSVLYLRMEPPANGQRACITLAKDYEFAGAVAQLGERRRGTAEVRGSSPLSSTSSARTRHDIGAHEFRNLFGYYAERAAAGDEVFVRRRGRPYVRLLSAQEVAATAPP